ncbi:MAG: hypothetical protein DWQ02_23360 [Bacteroidetes bacterium]|nr:MAG: hypothetical protein DWQ02_23360 [Bacteroidota bacterium]
MEYQEAKYIIDHFPRLMTELERKGLRQFFLSSKLGNPDRYAHKKQFERRKEMLIEKFGYEEDSEFLKMFENGYETFVIKTAERISKDSPEEFKLNKCPNCDFLTRTPYAKQCRKCSHNWHDEVGAEIQFDSSFRIKGIPYFWIVGELVKGHFETGYRVDLTNFQMNIIAEIKRIEFCLKTVDGVKKDLPSLGIEVDNEQEQLIKRYLTKSAKTVMILKEKEHGS